MFKKNLFLFILIFLNLRTANADWALAVCSEYIQKVENRNSLINEISNLSFFSKLKLLVDRSSLVEVVEYSEAGNYANVVDQIINKESDHFIFIPQASPVVLQMEKELKYNRNFLKKQINEFVSKYLNPLDDAKDIQDCVNLINQVGLTIEQIEKVKKIFFEHKKVSDILAIIDLDRIGKSIESKYPNIRIIRKSRFEEVDHFIKLSLVRDSHIVFVVHGGKDGFISDFSDQYLPPYFFREISANSKIKSLTIFGCHTSDFFKRYRSVFDDINSRNDFRLFAGMPSGVIKSQSLVETSLFQVFLKKYFSQVFNYFEYSDSLQVQFGREGGY